MALSLIERMGLQKQARTLQVEISSGDLGLIARLNKQKEWHAILLKLNADAKPEPEPESGNDETDDETDDPEVNSKTIVGFSVNGINHPQLAKLFEKQSFGRSADIVLSNEAAGIVIAWEPKQGFERDSLSIGWRGYSDSNITIPAARAWAGVTSPFPANKRKQVRRFITRALKAVQDLIANPITTDGVSLSFPWDNQTTFVKASKDGSVTSSNTVTDAVNQLKGRLGGGSSILELIQGGDYRAAALAAYQVVGLSKVNGEPIPYSSDEIKKWLDLIPDDSVVKKTFAEILQQVTDAEAEQARAAADAGSEPELQPEPTPTAEPESPQIVSDFLADKFIDQPKPEFIKTLGGLEPYLNVFLSLDDVIPHAANWVAQNIAA